LEEMINAHNRARPDDQILINRTIATVNPTRHRKNMLSAIDKKLKDKCTTHKCWTRQKFTRLMEASAYEELSKYTHRPDAPHGKFTWLSTIDINDVMSQYQKKHPDFIFFGAVPMDFSSLKQLEISSVDFNKLNKKGIRKLGVVFNLDNHDQPGSHWVAMFADLEKGYIFYFDSYGTVPEPRVRDLMRKIVAFMRSKDIPFNKIRAEYNKTQHQRKNSECGVYSMNFIIRLLEGDDFVEVCKNVVNDDSINKCREIYFSKYEK